VLRVLGGLWVFDINHNARQMKKTSSTDFCSRPSKKMAGAYSASIKPAHDAGAAGNRRDACGGEKRARRGADDHWMMRTSSRLRPPIA